MIYLEKDNILIRDINIDDARIITEEEIKQGWHQDINKYLNEIKDNKDNKAITIIAEFNNQVAGYVSLYFKNTKGPKELHNLPIITDLGVLEKYRNNGIGNSLMDVIENLAKSISNKVVLGVGLHNGYGSAQRIYVKRGYIFDGSGVWYKDAIADPYSIINNDDDLILYMYKDL